MAGCQVVANHLPSITGKISSNSLEDTLEMPASMNESIGSDIGGATDLVSTERAGLSAHMQELLDTAFLHSMLSLCRRDRHHASKRSLRSLTPSFGDAA